MIHKLLDFQPGSNFLSVRVLFPYIMCSSTSNPANSGYQNIMHQKWEQVKSVYTVLGFLLLPVVSNAETTSSWKGEGKGTGSGGGRMQWLVWQCHWRLEGTTGVSAMLLQVCRFWVFAGVLNIECCHLSWTEYPEPRAGGKHTLLKPIRLCFPSSSYAGWTTLGYVCCSHASQYGQALQGGLGLERMDER